MKKQIFILVAIFVSVNVFGQLPNKGIVPPIKDTTVKAAKDTVFVPVYLVDITDTVPANITFERKKGKGHLRLVKGYALYRGFKVYDKEPKWVVKPDFVGALDAKKKPIKNVIQVL
mgnify:CR=1 FL=1